MTKPKVFTIAITQYSSTQLKSLCYGPVFNKVIAEFSRI